MVVNNETVKDRLLKFLEYTGFSQGRFEKTIGVSNGYINNVKSIGSDKLSLISIEYPQLNIVWLLTGEGQMIKNEYNDYYKPLIDRVHKLAETLHETQYSFLKKIKYPLSSIDSIKGGDDINELIRCIFKAYPNINIGWLLTGPIDGNEGMFRQDGVTIRLLREKLGYSISEISEYLGVQEHYYKSLEDGEIPLEDDYRKLLAEKYQVEELGLISEDDYIPPKSKRLTDNDLEEKDNLPIIDNTPENTVSESQTAYGNDPASLIKENKDLKNLVKELGELNKVLKEMIEVQKGAISDKETIIELLKETINISSSVKEKSTLK